MGSRSPPYRLLPNKAEYQGTFMQRNTACRELRAVRRDELPEAVRLDQQNGVEWGICG
ncbi:hypothetical protein ACFOLF_23485 [Paenibacillus sepulcri]